jgi:phage tail tape-measure protein
VPIVLHAVAVVVLGFALASSAQAQEPEDASLVGARVRVRYCNASGRKSADGKGPCYRTEGQLLAITPDALRVQPSKGTVCDFLRADVTRLEQFLGTSQNTGLGVGLLMGIAVGASAGDDAVAAVVVGAPLVGGAVGALIGAGLGSLPKERWKDFAEDTLTVAVGRVGLGLRVAF